MNRLVVLLLALVGLPLSGLAEKWDVSGSLESTATAAVGAGGAPERVFGFENSANGRLQAKIGSDATVNAAVNLIAAAGPETQASTWTLGPNYASTVELERLSFRLSGDTTAFEAGLMRLAFGYGQAWSPSDFLTARNPLIPDARPRGVLASSLALYPSDTTKTIVFGTAANDPLSSNGAGTVWGMAADAHGGDFSLQGLYAFQTPSGAAERGIHRMGVSIKTDTVVGVVVDSLYSFDGKTLTEWRGLQAALGIDASLLNGNLVVLGQYLYNGPGFLAPGDDLSKLYSPETPWEKTAPSSRLPAAGVVLAEKNRRDYLFTSLLYRWDDYTSSTIACMTSLDDGSASPSLTFEQEPVQGLTVSITGQVPLDARTFLTEGREGEWGPINTGTKGSATVKAKLKF